MAPPDESAGPHLLQQPSPPMGSVASGWLEDPAFDLTFILGLAALACGVSAITAAAPSLFVPFLTAHIWLLGYDHVFATYTKLAGRPEDRATNRALIWYLPPVVLAALLTLGTLYGAGGLYTLYLFGQWFHTIRQSWGLAQRYRRQAGGLPWDDARLSEATMWSVPLWGILHRCHQHPVKFLFQAIHLPRVPLWVVQGAGLACGALLLYWAVTRVQALLRGELAVGHTLFVITHFVVFYLGYVAIDDIDSGWLLVNVWHNAQYLMFVWLHNRQRFSAGVEVDARALSWLCQPGSERAALYFLSLLGISIPFYLALLDVGDGLSRLAPGLGISLALVASLTLNFHHYLVDGVVWKHRPAPAVSPMEPWLPKGPPYERRG